VAPLWILDQTVALQVGQCPRQFVVDQALELLVGTRRRRRRQLARGESAIGKRPL
jgi:hypothetical protein